MMRIISMMTILDARCWIKQGRESGIMQSATNNQNQLERSGNPAESGATSNQ
jgi:hypothetical protein